MHVVTYMTHTFLINSVDCSVIYDKHILGNVATYVYIILLIRLEHYSLILFASMHQIKILLWNRVGTVTCEPEYEKPI